MTDAKKPKAHVAPAKKVAAKALAEKLRKAKIIGIINMESLPAAQLLTLRKSLRGKVEMFMTKRRVMKVAVDEVKKDIPGLDKLFERAVGMPAFLFTNENPFSLYKTLKKSKSPAPAKAGQIAPRDITIPAGPTPFAPGPVISELAALGIKSGVEGGKVAVKADSTVITEGKPFSAPLASMLLRLGIMPMEIGLNVVAVLENGVVYESKVLDIDENKFMADLLGAAAAGVNLAVEIVYMSKDTDQMILQKAVRQARALALESNFPADAVIEQLLAKGVAHAASVKSEAHID
ncbi:MAG: 50S ribosomal protein L10 [Nanoarchaeota archaeon]